MDPQNVVYATESRIRVITIGVPGPPGPLGEGAGFNDEEGDPTTVSAAAVLDGESDYAARRDHRHTLGTYTNATPTPATLGGIPAGTTFNNVSLYQIITDLLYPDGVTPPAVGLIYYGTSVSPVLNGAGIVALAESSAGVNANGTYAFGAGGYKYIAFPVSMTAAANFTDPDTGLPVSMAEPTNDAAYSSLANGWYYATVAVSGVDYRVYRTENILGGTFDITVA